MKRDTQLLGVTCLKKKYTLSIGDITRLLRLEAGSKWREIRKPFLDAIRRGHSDLGIPGEPELAEKFHKKWVHLKVKDVEFDLEELLLFRYYFKKVSWERIQEMHKDQPFDDIDTLRDIFLLPPLSPKSFGLHTKKGQKFEIKYERKSLARRLGRSLKEMRLALGLTQQQLAAQAGLSQQDIARLEKGFYVPLGPRQLRRYIEKVERILHVLERYEKNRDKKT